MKEFLLEQLTGIGYEVYINRHTLPSPFTKQKITVIEQKHMGSSKTTLLFDAINKIFDRLKSKLEENGIIDISISIDNTQSKNAVVVEYYFKKELTIDSAYRRIKDLINYLCFDKMLEVEKLSIIHIHTFIIKSKIENAIINESLMKTLSISNISIDNHNLVFSSEDIELIKNVCWVDIVDNSNNTGIDTDVAVERALSLEEVAQRITPKQLAELFDPSIYKPKRLIPGQLELSRKEPTTDGGMVYPKEPKRINRTKILGYPISKPEMTVQLEIDGSIPTNDHNLNILKHLMYAFGYEHTKKEIEKVLGEKNVKNK